MANLLENEFYRKHYDKLIMVIGGCMVAILILGGVVLYQVFKRPLPWFNAIAQNGKTIELTAETEPNLTTSTLLKWASKAAVSAYTFDFVNYEQQTESAHSYFTPSGWVDYQQSIQRLLSNIQKAQLFVNGVVIGTPVIANQGILPNKGYSWRIQMPFLVTYQSADTVTPKTFTVILSVVRVPTTDNPAAIGIDSLVMK